jgi:hypothetical protein
MVWAALASVAHALLVLLLGEDTVEAALPVPVPSAVQAVQWSPDEGKFTVLDHFGGYTIWMLQGPSFRLGYIHLAPPSARKDQQSKLSSSVDQSSRILRLSWWSETKLALLRGNDSLSIVNSSLHTLGGKGRDVVVSTTGLSKDSPSSEAANLLFASCQLYGVVALGTGSAVGSESDASSRMLAIECKSVGDNRKGRASGASDESGTAESAAGVSPTTLFSHTMDCQDFRVVDIRGVRAESLIQAHIDRGEFEAALSISTKFRLTATFETVVLKAKWNSMCAEGSVLEGIDACLAKVPDRELEWVAEQCARVAGDTYDETCAVLEHGLRRLSTIATSISHDSGGSSATNNGHGKDRDDDDAANVSLQLWRLLLVAQRDHLETYHTLCESSGPESESSKSATLPFSKDRWQRFQTQTMLQHAVHAAREGFTFPPSFFLSPFLRFSFFVFFVLLCVLFFSTSEPRHCPPPSPLSLLVSLYRLYSSA